MKLEPELRADFMAEAAFDDRPASRIMRELMRGNIEQRRRGNGGMIEIREAAAADVPMDLLLLADPSEEKIRSYLPRSRGFVASKNGEIVGVCVIQPLGAGTYELMNIAVHPSHQNSGHGATLLKWVIDFFHDSGAKQLEVGTGTFGYQLAFYQRQGFRVTSIDRDFFIKSYGEPIFEDGIQLFDMLRLTLVY
jgi:ribosomal protein S18 acetylase RimI-like enzyme